MATRTRRKRAMAEINIVPYVDVMLVLLVIFMITATLLNQGVEVDLPQAEAEALPQAETRPLVLSIDRNGLYYLNLAEQPTRPIEPEDALVRAAAVLKRRPGTAVLVKADRQVDYGLVVEAMVLLQRAGAASVGLSTRLPEG